jgi:hypothetical protein
VRKERREGSEEASMCEEEGYKEEEGSVAAGRGEEEEARGLKYYQLFLVCRCISFCCIIVCFFLWSRASSTTSEEEEEEEEKGSQGQSAGRREGGRGRSTTGFKRNYFWCPVVDCASGPVQKMGQHLLKVHKMDREM